MYLRAKNDLTIGLRMVCTKTIGCVMRVARLPEMISVALVCLAFGARLGLVAPDSC